MPTDRDIEHEIHGSSRVPPAENLFTTFADRVLLRVDAALNDRMMVRASDDAKRLLRALQGHVGARRAMSRADLTTRLKMNDRTVRDLVHELRRVCGIAIGAARAEDGGGYYLMDDETDCQRVSSTMIGQGVETILAGMNMVPNQSRAEVVRRMELALHVSPQTDAGTGGQS